MKLITLFGADAKVGVTASCQSLAEAFAENNKGKTIVLLHLDGKEGLDYSNYRGGKGLDDLKAAICSRVLTREELASSFGTAKQSNLLELPGIRNYEDRREFRPEHVTYLLGLCSQFDVVFVDAGSNFESGLAIGALRGGGHNLLVTTQQQCAFRQYQNVKNQILEKLDIRFEALILNQRLEDIRLLGCEQLKKRYQLERLLTLPYCNFGWQAESDRESLLHFKDTEYNSGVKLLDSYIAQICGYEEAVCERSTSIWRRLRRRTDG